MSPHQKKVRDHLERSFVASIRDDVDALHGKGMRTQESHTRASTSARHAQAREPPPPAFPLRTSTLTQQNAPFLGLAMDIASRAMLVWELTCGRHRARVLLLEHGLVRALAHATLGLAILGVRVRALTARALVNSNNVAGSFQKSSDVIT